MPAETENAPDQWDSFRFFPPCCFPVEMASGDLVLERCRGCQWDSEWEVSRLTESVRDIAVDGEFMDWSPLTT